MKIKSKVLGLILVSMMSVGVVGCSSQNNDASTQNQQQATDEAFVKDFEKAINKRWDEQVKLETKYAKDSKYTEEKYTEDTIKVLENEIATLEKNFEGIKDKDLKKIAKDYIEGAKKQIEAQKTNDYDLQYKYIEESDKLRKPALIAMVEEYSVEIKDAHQQTYKDFKEKATVINKENEAKSFADKLATEIALEKSTDEFGYNEYTSVVENTSELEFTSLSFKVQYKDADDVVIGDDIIYLENFAPGSKQKIKLTPFEEGVESVVISTDWFETK
ncbi:FxLYD domain-containing protein [Romboutsia sp.]|uniref:FxLYD domain-containing protein n=1 Tax=Romboutsia sp. TaxID=1965302 RepID=UPI003F33C5B2